MDHITRGYSDTLDEVKQKCIIPLIHGCGEMDANLFGLTDWIITDLQPVSFYKRPLMRRYSTFTPIFMDMLMVGVNQLMYTVEAKIRLMIPTVVAVMSDR